MLKKYDNLFSLNNSISKELFYNIEYPWEVLPKIKEFILSIGPTLGSDYNLFADDVWIHKSVNVADTALIKGPCIIGANTEIRHCAFIRGSAIIGQNCVVGNSTEIKNSILFDNVKCPHFNYVGDSILGFHSHTGAGVILSNVKSDESIIYIDGINTNLKKIGGIIGDYVEVGCNSVVNPGTIILPHTSIYPLTRLRGIIGENKIVKSDQIIVDKEVR